MKPSIINILTIQRCFLLPTAEALNYSSWSEEFKKQNLQRSIVHSKQHLASFIDLTDQEAELLGFSLWSKDFPMRLIPLWLYDYLTPGEKVFCINEKEETIHEDYRDKSSPHYIDNDHRGGMLAYGFFPVGVVNPKATDSVDDADDTAIQQSAPLTLF